MRMKNLFALAGVGLASTSVLAQPLNTGGLQIGMSAQFAAGAATVNDETLGELQGGGHDPNRNGFNVQSIETSFSASVDPYLDAQVNMVTLVDGGGETVFELEEAFFLTRALPYGLQVKGGQYYTEFGRLNNQHAHTWAFVDQPIISTRLLGGDGLRSQGARVSWLAPANWYSEIMFGVQNAQGASSPSFIGSGHVHEGEESTPEFAEHELVERSINGADDFLYAARWLNGFDVSDTLSANIGLSGMIGPNNSGAETQSTLYGTDFYLKWKPARTQRGFPFVSWHTEIMTREYEAGDTSDTSHEKLRDTGLFSYVLWGFKPGWVAGVRYELANGTEADHDESGAAHDHEADPSRDSRSRVSANLTWYPTEFSKLRLQYNYDDPDHLDEPVQSVWLQVEFNIGSHMAHTF